MSFSRSKRKTGGPSRGRRSRRGLSMVGVTLGMIIAATLLQNAVEYANIAMRNRIAAGRAQGLILAAHDLDADLARLVRDGQTGFLTTIPLNTAASVKTLPSTGIVLPTDADAPFAATPQTWTVQRYVADLTTAAGPLPYGLLYIKLPPQDAAMMPALKTALFAHASASAALETQDPSLLVAAAIGHTLDPTTELAIFTAPFAGLDPAAVLRAPRAGWASAQMSATLDMAGHDIASAHDLTAQSANTTALAASDLAASVASIGTTLASTSLATSGQLSAGTMTLGTLDAIEGQIGGLSASTMSGDAILATNATAPTFAAPEAAVTGSLSLPNPTSVSTGAVNNIASPESGGAGTLSANTLQASGTFAATTANLKHITVQTCSGC